MVVLLVVWLAVLMADWMVVERVGLMAGLLAD
jgi:hypothetical protein